VANLTEVVPASEWAGLEKRSKSEKLHDSMAFAIRARCLPAPVTELRFAKALGRQWRFDFAWPTYMVAVELEGLVMRKLYEFDRLTRVYKAVTVVMGRHASPAGIKEDMVKYNAAAQLGWTVLRFDQGTVKSGEAIDQTIRVLHAKGWRP
jgi:very-short-patch-repair endonuclease